MKSGKTSEVCVYYKVFSKLLISNCDYKLYVNLVPYCQLQIDL